jgi:hypothetical protein
LLSLILDIIIVTLKILALALKKERLLLSFEEFLYFNSAGFELPV